MNASPRWYWIYHVHGWRTAGRPATVCALSGGALALFTFAIGLLNAISVTKVFALALASAAISIAGLANCLISDARTAWRRGFKRGFRVGVLAQRDGLLPNGTAMSTRRSQLSVHNVQPTAQRGSRG